MTAMLVEPPTRLELAAARVTSIVWAMGYTFDYGSIRLPVDSTRTATHSGNEA